jgi:hypothetical protein
MKYALVLCVTALPTLVLSLGVTPSASAPLASLTGTWTGTGSDSQGDVNVTWVLTQVGSSITGTVKTGAVNPNDGSCSSCHRNKTGTLSGTLSGTTLTVTMDFAAGTAGDPTPICSATLSGSAASLADSALTTAYSGSDSCEGQFLSGTLPMTRQATTPPSITVQPASRLVVSGQAATLTVTAGASPLDYQWYRGASGTTSNPMEGESATSFTTPAITTATDFWVRVSNFSGRADSAAATLTPYQPFTDDVLTAGSSVIRAVHITELRTRIDTLRVRFGLTPYQYSDAMLTAGATSITAQHIVDLRTALAQAYVAAGLTAPIYTDPALTPGIAIARLHVAELRSAVEAIE